MPTRRDPALAAKFPEPPRPLRQPRRRRAPPLRAGTGRDAATAPADQTVEKLGARAKGVEFEIPTYKYEAIFRKQEELLEKPRNPRRSSSPRSTRSRDQDERGAA